MNVNRIVLSLVIITGIITLGCSKSNDNKLIDSIESFECDLSDKTHNEIFILKQLINEKNKLSGESKDQIHKRELVEQEISRRLNNLSESGLKELCK